MPDSTQCVRPCEIMRVQLEAPEGEGSYGRLGYGNQATIGDDELPSSAGDVNVGGPVLQIATRGGHTCALLSTRSIRCWGSGSYGELGYFGLQNIGDNELPASAGDVPLAP